MLKNINKIVTPELLKILCEMGHGDEIVIGDGNFPACSMNNRVIRMDACGGVEVLKAVLELIPLDSYAKDNFVLMNLTNGDSRPDIWDEYDKIGKLDENYKPNTIDRQEFYDRARKAYAVIATSEEALYACLILKKGVFR